MAYVELGDVVVDVDVVLSVLADGLGADIAITVAIIAVANVVVVMATMRMMNLMHVKAVWAIAYRASATRSAG